MVRRPHTESRRCKNGNNREPMQPRPHWNTNYDKDRPEFAPGSSEKRGWTSSGAGSSAGEDTFEDGHRSGSAQGDQDRGHDRLLPDGGKGADPVLSDLVD